MLHWNLTAPAGARNKCQDEQGISVFIVSHVMMFGLINLVVCNAKFYPSAAIIHIKVPLNGYYCMYRQGHMYTLKTYSPLLQKLQKSPWSFQEVPTPSSTHQSSYVSKLKAAADKHLRDCLQTASQHVSTSIERERDKKKIHIIKNQEPCLNEELLFSLFYAYIYTGIFSTLG